MGKIAGIVEKKFEDWTKDLNPIEARLAVFECIRDIPYAIVPKLRGPLSAPAGMLELNKGACQAKHYLLALLFGKLKIPVKFITCPFRWVDLGVKYPESLEKIVKDLPLSHHLTLKAHIDGRWVLVDATWDSSLSKAGFPVNEKWDSRSDTLNAVRSAEEVVHETALETADYEAEKISLYTEKEKTLYADFIDKLNRWFEELRG